MKRMHSNGKQWQRVLMVLLMAWAAGLAGGNLYAQNRDPDAGKSIQQVEKELAVLAEIILRGDSTEIKFERNKEFIVRLTNLLKRPESYDYPFDSLRTISRLRPEDDAFRIFTWYIVERPGDAYYADLAHYYFGLVQRKYTGKDGKVYYLVMPLIEMEGYPKGIESMVTNNYAWPGALYYAPRGEDYIQSMDGHYYSLVPREGGDVTSDKKETEQVVTFIPGRYKGRTLKTVDKLSYSNHKRVKTPVRYYLLMGWNGWDNKANYKMVDVLTFDPQDSMKVNFGAPIFYFDRIPKARAMFKYSDYASFSMNVAYVKSGLFDMFKKKMIVYDHLSVPLQTRDTEMWELGPDGSYDALSYYPRYGGYFEWYRKVETVERTASKKHRKEMEKLQLKYAAEDSLTFPDYNSLMSRKAMREQRRNTKRIYKDQRKENERRMKEAGIDGKARMEEK